MANSAKTASQSIEGTGKQILILEQSDYSALSALLYELADEAKLKEISRFNQLGLGGNHIERLSTLWAKLNGIED